ncbi:MAG: halocyanin domain-containing protein [Halobacteriaceae archaeon]
MSDSTHSRRQVLAHALGAGATATTLGAGASATAAAQNDEIDYGGWFENVSNFEGTVDRRGQDSVTVTVGAQGNGGPYAFDPPAVHVDPGTTVTWEWSGNGGHDVAATDDSFASELKRKEGYTFEHTFDSPGVTRYKCTPHAPMGMKGAVAVGDVSAGQSGGGGGVRDGLAIGGGLGLTAVLFGLLGLAARETSQRDGAEAPRTGSRGRSRR